MNFSRKLIPERYIKGQWVYVDIDNTVIDHAGKRIEHVIEFIEKLFEDRDCTLIAWSQGGADWAEHICNDIDIEGYFKYFLEKPSAYIDDLEFDDFCKAHVYPIELHPDNLGDK